MNILANQLQPDEKTLIIKRDDLRKALEVLKNANVSVHTGTVIKKGNEMFDKI